MLGLIYTIQFNVYKLNLSEMVWLPVRTFDSDFAEFSFYIIGWCICFCLLSVIFTVNKPGTITLKRIFEKPTIIFLLLFGFLVEVFAASTRVLQHSEIAISAFLFFLVYFFASLIVTFYNPIDKKYLLLLCSIGFICETTVGIMADISRGGTYFTVYFTAALLCGALLGRFIGVKLNTEKTLKIIRS
jgi:hypothetical protein